jgi:hypothetical protein
LLGFLVRDKLENQIGRLQLLVHYHIVQLNDVGTPEQRLQNLRLSVDLLLADGLQDFDDTLCVVLDIDPQEDLAVLSAA